MSRPVWGTMGVPGDLFRDEIGRRESSDDWEAERTEPVALGRYQLRIIALGRQTDGRERELDRSMGYP